MTDDILYYNTVGNSAPQRNDTMVSGRDLLSLIEKYDNPIGIEIGTDVGETAEFLLRNNKSVFLHCIDPYIRYTDWNGNDLNDRDMVYNTFMNKISPFEGRYKLHRNISDNVVSSFKDDSIDFIFIDGLHEYDQVLKDCENYYGKLKSGALFSGHDFNAIKGVRDAVIEFSKKVDREIKTARNDIWYWEK